MPRAPPTQGVSLLTGSERCLLWSKTIRIKSKILRQELVDDPDQLSGAMSKGGIVTATLGTLQVVVFLEGFVVLHDIIAE